MTQALLVNTGMLGVLNDWLIVLPVVLPMIAAALCVVFWKNTAAHKLLGPLGMALHLGVSLALFVQIWLSGPQIMTMGNWGPPFGISFVADLLGAGLVAVTGIVGLLISIFGQGDVRRKDFDVGFQPLLLGLMTGVSGAFLTGDIFNLYVWFEVILISSFGLLVLGASKEQIDGAVKYAALNLVATTLFLLATGLLYGATGTLNIADLAMKIPEIGFDGPMPAIAMLYLVAFGMKAAAFPLFFWLPASYHTPYPAVSALFGALLTKVGVYALYRVFTVIFPVEPLFQTTFLVVAVGTMLLGAIGALAQNDLRRMVSYIVISGIGFMLLGLGLGNAIGLQGSVFYLVHSMVVTAALFMGAGIACRMAGTARISDLGDIYKTAPLASALFLMGALSVAGIPPFTGFWAKVMLVQASLEAQMTWVTVSVLLSGFLTLVAVGRAFAEAFWRERKPGAPVSLPPARKPGGVVMLPFAALVLISLGAGLWAAPVVQYAQRVSAELQSPQIYVRLVLADFRTDGGGSPGYGAEQTPAAPPPPTDPLSVEPAAVPAGTLPQADDASLEGAEPAAPTETAPRPDPDPAED